MTTTTKKPYQFKKIISFINAMNKFVPMFSISAEPHFDNENNSCVIVRKETMEKSLSFAITKSKIGYFIEMYNDGTFQGYDQAETLENLFEYMINYQG